MEYGCWCSRWLVVADYKQKVIKITKYRLASYEKNTNSQNAIINDAASFATTFELRSTSSKYIDMLLMF